MNGLAEQAPSPRARAAETKRTRSRAALLEAAGRLFRDQGWLGTRMEDIAHEAGLSAATAYNHFESKHHLIGAVYAPLFLPLQERAESSLAAGRPIIDVIHDLVYDIAELARREQQLTTALVGAMSEVIGRIGEPVSANDPRVLVPFPRPLRDVIAEGQRRGELRPDLDAAQAAAFLTTALLMRLGTRPEQSAQETADLTLAFLFGAFVPR